MKKITKIDILGTKISILDYSKALSEIRNQKNKQSSFICVAAVHLVMESYKNIGLQRGINKSLFTTSDGMPLVWFAKHKLKKQVNRVYGPNLMLKTCKMAEKEKLKVFLLGGAKDQGLNLKKNLINKFPELKIVGMIETPIRPIPIKRNKNILNEIKTTKPDIIFVGLGCPLQEEWMISNYKKVNKGVFIGVGAAFDFISGKVKQAPKWIQNVGLEWFFRLLQDPIRLWKRYLIYNTEFIFHILINK